MRKYLIVFISLFSMVIQAQTQAKPKQASPIPAYIDKTWKINSIEEFGVASRPKPKSINDILRLNADNTFLLRVDSVDVTGKYTRSGKSIILKNEAQQVYYVTVIKEKSDTLVVQCKNPDYVLSTYTYIK